MIGFDVETFASADEFLETHVASGPKGMILDVWLQGMTGHADADVETDTRRLGALGFLEKPFQTQELLNNIQKAVAPADENEQDPLP